MIDVLVCSTDTFDNTVVRLMMNQSSITKSLFIGTVCTQVLTSTQRKLLICNVHLENMKFEVEL